ncbi:hypothetical protein VPH35_120522 [Triticum aestivum]
MRRGLELPTLDARRIDRGCVQRLPDGAVIPASGRRSQNRPADTPTRSARRRNSTTSLHSIEIRGRSPLPSPRTTHRDIIELRPSSAGSRSNERSPPSPRTTFQDIIELRPSSTAPDWLHRVNLGLGSPAPNTPPVWPSCLPPRLMRRATSSTTGSSLGATPSTNSPTCTPVFVPRTPTSSPPRTPPIRRMRSPTRKGPTNLLQPSPPLLDGCTPTHPSGLLRLSRISSIPSLPAGVTSAPQSSQKDCFDQPEQSTPIFVPCQQALLPSPTPRSTPPRPPTRRRKTLVGISSFTVGRSSPQLQAKNRSMPIAKLSEKLLCQRLGIIEEGEMMTEEAINKYVTLFNGKLPDIAVAALRALFKLDCDLATAVEDALVEHGGDTAPDLQAMGSEEATATT